LRQHLVGAKHAEFCLLRVYEESIFTAPRGNAIQIQSKVFKPSINILVGKWNIKLRVVYIGLNGTSVTNWWKVVYVEVKQKGPQDRSRVVLHASSEGDSRVSYWFVRVVLCQTDSFRNRTKPSQRHWNYAISLAVSGGRYYQMPCLNPTSGRRSPFYHR